MERRKRWQLVLIVAVLALTIYNILPTIFFYSQPLNKPVNGKMAAQASQQIAQRVDNLESESISWVAAFAKNLGIKPRAINPQEGDPRLIRVEFDTSADAGLFRNFLPRGGALIPFVPAQLSLSPTFEKEDNTTVLVERRISTQFDSQNLERFFTFSEKRQEDGLPTPFYRTITNQRFAQVAVAAGGISEPARIALAAKGAQFTLDEGYLFDLASQIVDYKKTFGLNSPITQRFYASFTQVPTEEKGGLIAGLTSAFEKQRLALTQQIDALAHQQREATEAGELLELAAEQRQNALERQGKIIDDALGILRANVAYFEAGQPPLTYTEALRLLADNEGELRQTLPLDGRNPLIQSLALDWENETIDLELYPDVEALSQAEATEVEAYAADKVGQMIVNEVAYIGRLSDESLRPSAQGFSIALSNLAGSESFLAINLGAVAGQQLDHVKNRIEQIWHPTHPDLNRDAFPMRSFVEHQQESAEAQKLGLVFYAPSLEEKSPIVPFRAGSIYVIAKGVGQIVQKTDAEDTILGDEFEQLQQLLAQSGFVGYLATQYGFPAEFKDDYIFERGDYFGNLLTATREDFSVHGAKKMAVLEFTDYKQRLLTLNEIETQMHEDLLRWRDEYQAAQVDLNLHASYYVPPPTKSVVWDNLALSTLKYFRGDERKILKWGLDLSGGKTITIGLLDRNGKKVTSPIDLEEGANQLYARVNKMGVSEVEIRTEGDNIVLSFPGAQGMSASELVQGSTMSFHMINEKFGRNNPTLASAVQRFLQEVWNEAVVTNRQDVQNINEIAWQHLGGDLDDDGAVRPRSEAAQVLYDSGLRLANPHATQINSTFDDTLSSIAMFRGESFAEWQGQSNPLIVVFANYALTGASVENIRAQYDPAKGNILLFGVSKSVTTHDGARINPQADFYAWTSHYAEDKVVGTPNELYSNGRGWRMAVVFNDRVISAPSLINALKDSVMVQGQFSQREVNALVADFKAGSLTFVPKILSERNVSPELGLEERHAGMIAAGVGLLAVILLMSSYYRFAGIIASLAVLFNLLIMWGVLQNLDAALTLPGIAGIILTVGMAVDANVLVFERIREEFAVSGRLASAVNAGYKKAFTAILDSNLTTIIAALILLNFDAGPIKGFAVTLIVGIVSSMFTSLFMTRYFFAGWVANPKHSHLKMASLFDKTNFNFLGKAKMAMLASIALIIIGGGLLVTQRHTMFGMDFTGGYALNIALEEQADVNYRMAATNALIDAGATSRDVQVRELNRPNHLRLQLGMGLEQVGGAFYQLPQELAAEGVAFGYEKNPRIVWVVDALRAQGLEISDSVLAGLEAQWNVMSGQFSNTMRNNALLGLGLALLSILVYITIRFEFKFAISAIVALAHDLLISIGSLAILRVVGVPVQIDLQVVGALMTIVGYSLNDTIIIFDRIREDGRIMRKLKFPELINHALNTTLNRTLMTSGTTLVVLLALVVLGGSAIFDFSLVMTLGVIFGTFSSLFIAAPILLYFHNRELARIGSVNAVSRA